MIRNLNRYSCACEVNWRKDGGVSKFEISSVVGRTLSLSYEGSSKIQQHAGPHLDVKICSRDTDIRRLI